MSGKDKSVSAICFIPFIDGLEEMKGNYGFDWQFGKFSWRTLKCIGETSLAFLSILHIADFELVIYKDE